MYNLITIKKLMKRFLLTGNIDKIDLYIISIKIYLHLYLVFYLDHFNILKSDLFVEQLAVSQ